jgi:hypothetical protein
MTPPETSKTPGRRVSEAVRAKLAEGKGQGGDPEKRKAARGIVREKVGKIKDRMKERQQGRKQKEDEREDGLEANRARRQAGRSQESPATGERYGYAGGFGKPREAGEERRSSGGTKPAPQGTPPGPMADAAAKREEFKSAMLERRASRQREKGEPPEDRGDRQS